MSDVNDVHPDRLTDAHPHEATNSSVAPGSLAVAVHPDYDVQWEPDSTTVALGTTGPLKFSIARTDGNLVDVPDAATLTIALPDGTSATLTPDLESAEPSLPCILAQSYLFSQAGTHYVQLVVTIGNDRCGTVIELECAALPAA